ncbi:MAG: DUF4870 domain-containing protein [Chloroflexota bacterium]|nr:DUF4870 domain-containing protein [Chloroflexota bacterium]
MATEEQFEQFPEEIQSGGAAGLTHDEMTMAALAHAGIVLGLITNGLGGIVVALAIWLYERERSAWVSFQALQALVFQIALLAVTVLVGSVVGVLWAVVGTLAAIIVGLFLIPPAGALTLLLIAIPLAGLGYGLYAAYETYHGREVHYWLVADFLKRERVR